MTVIEVLKNSEDILGSLEVSGRSNVRKINTLFDMLDAVIAALSTPPKDEKGGNNGTVSETL